MGCSRAAPLRLRLPLEIAPRGQVVRGALGGESYRSGGVVFGEGGLEFLANAALFLRYAVGIVAFPFFHFGWQVNRGNWFASGIRDEFFNRGDYAFGIQLPFDQQAIRGQAAMQWAGGDTIEIWDQMAAKSAEAIEIEMSVASFQRVERPFDSANVAAERFFAL